MLTFNKIVDYEVDQSKVLLSVTLTYDFRQKSRHKTSLDSGEEIGIVLPRGSVLKNNDVLADDDNLLLKVIAATESVSMVTANNLSLFAQLCYHLGNRHVPLQISRDALSMWACYGQDSVLDQMVRSLGGEIKHKHLCFEPERGAYHQHQAKNNGHEHSHSHD